VPLGIARHAIDTLVALAGSKSVSRSPQVLSQHAMVQADIGRAEALLRSGRAFLYETLSEAWQVVTAGELLTVTQRAMLWLAATQATTAAMQAVDLMFRAGGSASIYTSSPLERCVRDIRTAGQHVSVVPSNYEMVGQALLGFDMRTTLLAIDDRSAG
jgi:alkylation response protein AidB-like acyl-CoA dehydrogenase